jgi:hypothetical protein
MIAILNSDCIVQTSQMLSQNDNSEKIKLGQSQCCGLLSPQFCAKFPCRVASRDESSKVPFVRIYRANRAQRILCVGPALSLRRAYRPRHAGGINKLNMTYALTCIYSLPYLMVNPPLLATNFVATSNEELECPIRADGGRISNRDLLSEHVTVCVCGGLMQSPAESFVENRVSS